MLIKKKLCSKSQIIGRANVIFERSRWRDIFLLQAVFNMSQILPFASNVIKSWNCSEVLSKKIKFFRFKNKLLVFNNFDSITKRNNVFCSYSRAFLFGFADTSLAKKTKLFFEKNLFSFVELNFNSVSPLLPDWYDFFLFQSTNYSLTRKKFFIYPKKSYIVFSLNDKSFSPESILYYGINYKISRARINEKRDIISNFFFDYIFLYEYFFSITADFCELFFYLELIVINCTLYYYCFLYDGFKLYFNYVLKKSFFFEMEFFLNILVYFGAVQDEDYWQYPFFTFDLMTTVTWFYVFFEEILYNFFIIIFFNNFNKKSLYFFNEIRIIGSNFLEFFTLRVFDFYETYYSFYGYYYYFYKNNNFTSFKNSTRLPLIKSLNCDFFWYSSSFQANSLYEGVMWADKEIFYFKIRQKRRKSLFFKNWHLLYRFFYLQVESRAKFLNYKLLDEASSDIKFFYFKEYLKFIFLDFILFIYTELNFFLNFVFFRIIGFFNFFIVFYEKFIYFYIKIYKFVFYKFLYISDWNKELAFIEIILIAELSNFFRKFFFNFFFFFKFFFSFKFFFLMLIFFKIFIKFLRLILKIIKLLLSWSITLGSYKWFLRFFNYNNKKRPLFLLWVICRLLIYSAFFFKKTAFYSFFFFLIFDFLAIFLHRFYINFFFCLKESLDLNTFFFFKLKMKYYFKKKSIFKEISKFFFFLS